MTVATKDRKKKAPEALDQRQPAATQDATLQEIIHAERLRLMKAISILGCVTRAMENESVCTGATPYWPAAIESANDLIDEAIRRLDPTLRALAARAAERVRESGPPYSSATDADQLH